MTTTRKLITATIAALAIGGSMTAMSGEAFAGGKHGHGHGHGHRFHGGHFKNFYYSDYYSSGPSCYFVVKWYGPHKKLIKVCDPYYF